MKAAASQSAELLSDADDRFQGGFRRALKWLNLIVGREWQCV